VDARECAAALGMNQVQLLNDFTAQALAVPHLGATDYVALGGVGSAAKKPADSATFAVLGPGTGLGVSALLRRAGQQFALESEGGHAAFAPKTARQRAVLEHLCTRFERVSYERLISGSGLSNIHWALARIAGNAEPELLRPEQVTGHARRNDPLASEAVALFCEVFGAFAGDLVLTFGGWDGVFLSGGLVPLLLEELKGDIFRHAFENKGRFSAALARVPVFAVTHPQAGLLGAAATAMQGRSETVHARPTLQETRIAS
jgi:glucokinase